MHKDRYVVFYNPNIRSAWLVSYVDPKRNIQRFKGCAYCEFWTGSLLTYCSHLFARGLIGILVHYRIDMWLGALQITTLVNEEVAYFPVSEKLI